MDRAARVFTSAHQRPENPAARVTLAPVGQRSQSETLAAILKAFLDQRTWKQADLARRVGVQAATIKKQLEELRASGVPLESEKDHPHVFWSVPKSWYPGGVLFSGEQIAELFRQLSRLPKSKGRDQLIDTVRKFVPSREAPGAVVSPEVTAREEQFLPIIEDAATQKVALRFRYYSASRGSEDTRHASVQRVTPGPRASFLATCHRTGALKSFRVENVSEAKLDPREAFRPVAPAALEAHERASLDGFHGIRCGDEGDLLRQRSRRALGRPEPPRWDAGRAGTRGHSRDGRDECPARSRALCRRPGRRGKAADPGASGGGREARSRGARVYRVDVGSWFTARAGSHRQLRDPFAGSGRQ